MAAISSKEAQAILIDPMMAPEPHMETGPGSHFGSTFAPAAGSIKPTVASEASLNTKNPFRDQIKPASPTSTLKKGPSVTERAVSVERGSARHSRAASKENFPGYRAEAFGNFPPEASRRSGSASRVVAPSSPEAHDSSKTHRRRTSSLRQRYPGDNSTEPLSVIRSDSKKAHRSPHLTKRHLPGADLIDRLDPALGGRAYHHEGPYDAALLSRNTNVKHSPIAALETSNAEALKATPAENIKDAVERHMPLDGVAIIPPGVPDRFGRTYNYEEGADLLREPGDDAGYKRWAGETYDNEDLKGHAEPGFSLDRALRAHKIDEEGIEMQPQVPINEAYHKAERTGTLDTRDPVTIAGDDRKYAEMYHAKSGSIERSGSLKEGLKKRIGSLRRRKGSDEK